MIARRLKSSAELKICLDISTSTSLGFIVPEFGVDWKTVAVSLGKLASGTFFRVLEHNGEIVGWISANITRPAYYSKKTALQLDFYHCKLKGYAAVTALRVAHESLAEAATQLRSVSLAITTPCPHTPECFNKILEKDGWVDYGSMLLKEVSFEVGLNRTRKIPS